MVRNRMDSAPATGELLELFMHYFSATAILAAAELGLADAIGDEARSVTDIATATGTSAPAVGRLLRGLAGAGVFRETTPNHFAHTPRSLALRTDAPGHARDILRMFGLRSTREAMVEYEHAIRTGDSAFERVHGVAPFELLAARPDEAAIYHAAMASDAEQAPWIVRKLDLANVDTLVDVGGGRGVLLGHALVRHPGLRGVLFDLPEVVAGARPGLDALGVIDRCELRGGDLRREVPVGDAYVLKNILHGWADTECVELLRRVGVAAGSRGRVFVIENVMPPGNDERPCKPFDLFLLLGGTRSRVRTAEDFRQLFEASGLVPGAITPVFADQCVIAAHVP
jgi:hypothetical protein